MSVIKLCNSSGKVTLTDPNALPLSAAYLWNKKLMVHVNCRGFVTAQFMQPEPTKYAKHPFLEAVSFMQPEQPYYAHHPGRFFYIKDCDSGDFFSAPYEPCRNELDKFEFIAGQTEIRWCVEALHLRVELCLRLPTEHSAELWSCSIKNLSSQERNISIYSYFPFGFMSWMNQSGYYSKELNAIVGKYITPYQKLEDYDKNKHLKDLSFLLCDQEPHAWDARQSSFEGQGGLTKPSGVQNAQLSNSDALYEVPTAAMQFNRRLKAGEETKLKFIFGPAFNEDEIRSIRDTFFKESNQLKEEQAAFEKQLLESIDILEIETEDPTFDHFVNHWLSRQVYYHGDVNRLSTDPQTRNYLQDNMGMAYIKPKVSKKAFITALSQQHRDGAMPDGVVLIEGGELKYINQIPHTDHCVWLPICLQAYLDEHNDYEFLNEKVGFGDSTDQLSVLEHISLAMNWLLTNRDYRGLAFIAQGDWCDPMNMVGHKGKGVSGWLTMAIVYALKTWSKICADCGKHSLAQEFRQNAEKVSKDANEHLWDGNWYARGITDDNVKFGISDDEEGRIFLNPQSWALLGEIASAERRDALIKAIEEQLETPYGTMMLAPAYTGMREDVGRVTQKFPGSAENGSIYNHAAAFYVYALYQHGYADRAFDTLRKMISGPSEEDYLQRGQLPVFIPNYYRGAYYQHPRTAGRSSQLFNTGTVHWVLRSLIDGLFGVKGNKRGLNIQPQLPSHWHNAKIKRKFRGATFNISITRATVASTQISVDGHTLAGTTISEFNEGSTYEVLVSIPA